jgi:IS30 family transposase
MDIVSCNPERKNITKLRIEQVKQIKKLLKEGNSTRKIAKQFNVKKSTIAEISRGKNWKWLD